MCYCVYLGTDTELPVVAFDSANPVLSMEPVAGWETTVAQHFSKQNIYHAGSWQGCSCGFAVDIESEAADILAKSLTSVKALLGYVNAALEQEDTIEFYTCWAGNEWQPPQERRKESIYTISAEPAYFALEEDVFLTFTRHLL